MGNRVSRGVTTFPEPSYRHPSLTAEFYETYELEEAPRPLSTEETVFGARCKLRSSQTGERYYVLIEHCADMYALMQLWRKADLYLDFRAKGTIPAGVATLPPTGAPWTNWRGREERHLPRVWIVTEFVPTILADTADMPSPLPLLAEVAQAARSLHDAGYVHGDIAPPNIGIREGGAITLIDLGEARAVKYVPPGEGYATSAGHEEFMSIQQHDTSVVHPADDVESAAYVALWCYSGLTMSSAEEKRRWLDSDDGDQVEAEIRRVARRAFAFKRHEPPSEDLYRVAVT